ncbi:MAG: hypothetical protein AAGA09_03230 [Pseudomonadota bacterium]
MTKRQSVNMNIYDFRDDPNATEWTLPAWGYPLAVGVNPLFIELDDRIWPIGTAFNLGGGIGITVSAFHCIEEALKRQPTRNNQRLFNREIKDGTLERCNFFILRSYRTGKTQIQFHFLPLEKISAGPPADIAFCSAKFVEGNLSLDSEISFALPALDQPIHSIGYCDFKFPAGGVALSDINDFDWENEYDHKFKVVEGYVENVFTHNYAQGYVRGPCFTFTESISSGMSGGPIYDLSRGVIFGMNSATAFEKGFSIGSLFFPYVLNTITFGADIFGDPRFRINSTQNIIQMLEFGSIRSDGTHSELAYHEVPEGVAVSMRIPPEYRGRVFNDLNAKQSGTPPSTYDGPIYRRVKKAAENG